MIVGLSLGRPPKKLIRPCRGGVLHRLLLGDAGRRRGDGDVDTAAVGEVHDRLDDVDLAGADRLVGLDDAGGLVEARAVELDQRDAASPVGPCEADVQAADRAGPDDDDVVALADAGQVLGVDRARERLGDRGLGDSSAPRGCG